ncbi:hypothetical protein OIU78_008864 [Salix suchowensis]|nr:hypothetical protein OIU78_008864 [Salix suchowensis]
MVTVIVLGGFIITKDDIELWMRWGYYLSPIMYGQNAISINEFLDNRWGNLTGSPHESTVGKSLLKERGFFTDEYWYWICVGVLLGLSLIFNFLFIAALEFLNAPADSKAMIADDDTENVSTRKLSPSSEADVKKETRKAYHLFTIAVPGVPRIKQGSNPATWMLEISTEATEAQIQVDFAEVYATSELYRRSNIQKK